MSSKVFHLLSFPRMKASCRNIEWCIKVITVTSDSTYFNFTRHASIKTPPQNYAYLWVILKECPFSQFGSKSGAVSHCCTQSSIWLLLLMLPKRRRLFFLSHLSFTRVLGTWLNQYSASLTFLSFMDLLNQLEQTALLIISAFLPKIALCQSIVHKTKVEFYRQLLWELREAREHVLHVSGDRELKCTGFYLLPSHIRNMLQCQSPTGWGLGITDSQLPFSRFTVVI